jgi:sugar/nucleoside kinase (ribokinase family)
MTTTSPMTLAAVGVHVLDIHVPGVESIPAGSEGTLVDTIAFSPAGTAGGTAVVASRLGARVRSHGAVGDDVLGTTLRDLVGREHIDTTGLAVVPGVQTSASVIPVRPNGDRPALHCVGANARLDLGAVRVDDVTHVHLGGPEFVGGPAAAELFARARTAGAVTSMDVLAGGDPGLLEWIAEALPHVDYLLPNDDQVRGFTGHDDLVDGARELIRRGVSCVALTRGAQGALVVTDGDVIEVPAFTVDAVDTTGCGDSFSAGFLYARHRGDDLTAAARFGCAVAAHVVGGLTTTAGNYDADVVDRFMAAH